MFWECQTLWCCLLQVLRLTLAGPTLPLVPQGLFLQTTAHAIGASTQGFGHLFWNCPQMPSPEKRTVHLPATPREWPFLDIFGTALCIITSMTALLGLSNSRGSKNQ